MRALESLIEHPRNPNRHPPEQLRLLGKIIRVNGWRSPICISSRSGFVIKGHGRLQAARLAGLTEAPVDIQDYATEADEWADMVADNRIAELAEISLPDLGALLDELKDTGADMELSGFAPPALDDLLDSQKPEGDADAEPQINNAEELRAKWKTDTGQLWRIGDHRLLCGDSTKREDVDRVMDDEQAGMVFTDPPYNVAYVGKTIDALTIQNDAMPDTEFDTFLDSILCVLPLRAGGSYYVCAPAGHTETQFRCALNRASELSIRQCIVWVKDVFVMGRQDYHWRHESILYGWREGAAHYFIDDRTQDTVWNVPRPKSSQEHPTMKPVEIPMRAIKNSSRSSDIIWDSFLGSGTTMVAAQNLGRKCYGIEISPAYCAVILQRMADAFPELKIEREDANAA